MATCGNLARSTQSTAERRIFETIRDAPNTNHWVCLHSLGLAHHDTVACSERGDCDRDAVWG